MSRKKQLIEDLRWARLAANPPSFAQGTPRRRGRRAQGIKYEARLHEHLGALFGASYIPSLWFQYIDGDVGHLQWCQPDGLLFDFASGRITIVEVKYQHTPDAWYQLQRYLAVVRQVFGDAFTYAVCEVVKWYDCAVAFPEPVSLLADLRRSRGGRFQVHIWKP